jgi:hypothetical protein
MTNEKGAAAERCRVKIRQNDFERERLYERNKGSWPERRWFWGREDDLSG